MQVLLLALFEGAATGAEPAEGEIQRLVDRGRGGEQDALRRLYALHVDRVYRTVRPMCTDDAMAEDVTQDAFIKALTSLAGYRQQPGARFVAWLLTIAVNTARRRYRRQRPTALPPQTIDLLRDGSDGERDDPTGDAMDARRRREALLAALDELPERERRVLALRYGGDLTAAEVARVTGLSEPNVRKICQRQRRVVIASLQRMLPGAWPQGATS